MSPRHLACTLILVALAGSCLLSRGLVRSSPSTVPCGSCAGGLAPSSAFALSDEPSPFGLPSGNEADSRPAIVSVSPDRAVVIAEEVALSGLAQRAGLNLSGRELTAFAEITSCHGAIRHAYEARIAGVTTLAKDHYRVEIPPYPAAGAALKEAFYTELRNALGDVRAGEIVEKLGRQLDKDFAGFGLAEQSIEFVGRKNVETPDYTITRTIVISKRDGARNQVMTRRETYIPSIEDASGEQWGPFVAILPRTERRIAAGN